MEAQLVPQSSAQLTPSDFPSVIEAGIAYARNDYVTAVRILRGPADNGRAVAQLCLGILYSNGHGVEKSYTEAAKWYHLAANQELVQDHGLEKSYVAAAKWSRLAANQELARVEQHMTPAQIAEAQKLAREWKPTSER
jgi:TPR repeat protein